MQKGRSNEPVRNITDSQHYHPSTHNPNWGPQMEAELRAQLSPEGYVHEVLAEFGTQETGVFNKDKLDIALKFDNYIYNELTYTQQIEIERNGLVPPRREIYSLDLKPNPNVFRCMGVDWDKFGASSSLLILDYDVIRQKFKVIKRVEVPRSEYTYDNAIAKIVELNEIYNPSWIYCDSGAGEYQIERLHIIGDENPSTGLKHKVKRISFASNLEVTDPISFEVVKEPIKPFMVNQLVISFERDRMILSPYDTILHKQLTDYEVVRKGNNGKPVFTDENEHFVDALGLAHLAFVLEFKDLIGNIKNVEVNSYAKFTPTNIGASAKSVMDSVHSSYSKRKKTLPPSDDLPQDRQTWVKVTSNYRAHGGSSGGWGSRSSSLRSNFGRSSW